ncbi:interferon regulatory factor 7 isoform X2 [Neopelma chrysocephalum]|uniref:interferon regulatory factor 7 isoform X2 n=1 Tax=Neopelma chrysocephalum TaxID=114329 RepID=UPI000FCD2F90|nr:interferon regulatory factor 7 isoform X2 [Neopelma chrysocephalum]
MAAQENEGEAQRLRFVPWLLKAIDSGNYRGLRWLDRERTTFRVPWKHNARKDITSSDLEVFKAWAKVGGRYEESSEDPVKWKTNFRCAMTSTGMFTKLKDNSKSGEDPHMVFTINQATLQHSKEGDFSSPDPAVDQQPAQQQLQVELHPQDMAPEIALPGSTDPTQPLSLEKLLQQCDISPRDVVSMTPSWVPAGDTLHPDILLQPPQDSLLQLHADPSQNNYFAPPAFQQWVPTVEQPILGTYSPLVFMPPEETGAVPLPCHLTEGMVPMQSPGQAMFLVSTASPVPQPQQLVRDTGAFFSDLDVTIYYRGKEFGREIVQGSHCLLTYQPLDLAVAQGPWHVVNFPSPANMADKKQWRITEELLGKVGLQLEQRAHKVFATRREKCKVFWALSQQLEGVEDPPSNLLCRDQETPIFDFREFSTELRDFRNGQRRRSPDFTIYLCFGQAFSKAKPKEAKLILVKLVPKFCEDCYEKVLQEGASSLDSHTTSLQLSDSFSLYDLIEQYTMQLD